MNRIKKELEKELQSITLSEKRKQTILKKMHRKKHMNWSYRFALSIFMIFSVSFGLLLLQQKNVVKEATTTTEPMTNLIFISLFTSDWGKSVILIGIFIGIRIFGKRLLLKRGKGLPACIKCKEEWPYREALKISMRNEEIICPNCSKKQYKTRKSSMKVSMFTFLIPLGILIAQVFNHILLSYLIHVTGTMWLILTLTPYLIEFQEDDPMLKPLY